MASALAPKPTTVQRLLGVAVGTAAAAAVYISFQRLVWKQASDVTAKYGLDVSSSMPAAADDDMLFFGPKTRATLVRKWNKGIDATFGALATELAKRGL